ncbi:MAG: ion channel [Microcystaceae cyanobacterium]
MKFRNGKFRPVFWPRLGKTLRLVRRLPRPDPMDRISLDLYHWLLVISWRRFLGVLTGVYFGLTLLFAGLYLLTGDGIKDVATPDQPLSLRTAFFFSIHTLSTVGYGSMYPQTLVAHIIVAIEVFVGLLSIAILTGLMFARFSRPTARVLFSQVAVVCPLDGVSTLMFRAANRRDNRILEAQVRVSLVRDEVTQEGIALRRFYDLSLVRSQTPVFGLSWLIMHPIDEKSPFFGKDKEQLASEQTELWISLTGLDETFSQTIHSRFAYTSADILWNHRFVDIFSKGEAEQWYLNFQLFHQTEPVGGSR